ncbi:MAG: GNAT family N-acetyltransferase [Candidatus Omnitrophica bacterium]|nr:GNAT family N-acetyltransferase [Candidatus Omnitrophota bacterium]
MKTTSSKPKRASNQKLNRPFLVGKRIYLRPMEMTDLDGPYFDWLNDYEVTRFLETGSFPTTTATLRHYLKNIAKHPNNVMLAIMEKRTNRHVGNVKLGNIHPLHRNADIGIMVGDKRVWGKGYGSEAMELMLEYGFKRLNLHKITLGVYADHEGAVKAYKKLGFTVEGVLKEHLFRDGGFRDKTVMGILKSDYERSRRAGDGKNNG